MYSKAKKKTGGESSGSFAAPLHKDNGLILYLTPFPRHPLQLTDKYGFRLETRDLGAASVIIMFGRALSSWLLSESDINQFHAPTHGVLSLPVTLESRTVIARMKVMPDDALSQHGEYFGDFFTNSLENSNDGDWILSPPNLMILLLRTTLRF